MLQNIGNGVLIRAQASGVQDSGGQISKFLKHPSIAPIFAKVQGPIALLFWGAIAFFAIYFAMKSVWSIAKYFKVEESDQRGLAETKAEIKRNLGGLVIVFASGVILLFALTLMGLEGVLLDVFNIR